MFRSTCRRMSVSVWSAACRRMLEAPEGPLRSPAPRSTMWRLLGGALVAFVGLGFRQQTQGAETLPLQGASPHILFDDNAGTLQQWRLTGNSDGFVVYDDTTYSFATRPFRIRPATPTNTLYLTRDSLFAGNVGINGVPDDGVHLQVAAWSNPIIRMAESGFPYHEWDLRANYQKWCVRDNVADTTPFVIESVAPSNSLFVDTDGSVGIGTDVPNNTGAVTGIGKFFNVRADGATAATGVSNGVFQGTFGAQNHLVHLNGPVDQKVMRLQCSSGFFGLHVLTDDLATKAVADVLSIKMLNGNLGLRVQNPTQPLHLASGAHCTTGGVWTNASSRAVKQDIEPITLELARDAVRALQPVGYRYKNEPEEHYVGFIAEDVPDLVATNDRKSLAPMDVVAVLTKVVQNQDKLLAEERQRNTRQERLLEEQQAFNKTLLDRLAKLEQRLAD